MSVQNVLNNAQLLSLILNFAGVSTCARLASTSSSFFRQGIVHIWKNLTAPKPLILLIPGAHELQLEPSEYTIRLPPPPADFSRFDIYGPLVHSLVTFSPDNPGFNIDASWQTLIFRGRETTLLPNLKEFTLNHCFKEDEEPVLWISAFVSPSFKALEATRVQRGKSSVTSSTMSIILRRVAYGCPNLESLTLFIGSREDTEGENRLFRAILEEPPWRTWRKFKSLTSLVTDVNALDADSLSSVGQLPHLNLLDIHGTVLNHPKHLLARLPSSALAVTLSECSFPCLRELTIRTLHNDDVIGIWNLKPLVEGLTGLTLFVRLSGSGAISVVQLSSKFLPVLSARSPQLTHLNILMPDASERRTLRADVECFKCLVNLPLSWVVIMSICLYDSGTGEEVRPSSAKQIAALWPNVVVLKLPSQATRIASLHYYAALPNLRHLSLNLRWSDERPFSDAITPVPGDLPLQILEFSMKITQDFASGRIEKLAKYLLSFWPNLERVTQISGSRDDPRVASLDLLNFCVRTFRGLAKTRQRIAQRYGEEAVKSLISPELNEL